MTLFVFRLEQLKAFTDAQSNKQVQSSPDNALEKHLTLMDELKQGLTSTRKTPTLKYNAKKTNTDQEHRAKTVDVVRLKNGK